MLISLVYSQAPLPGRMLGYWNAEMLGLQATVKKTVFLMCIPISFSHSRNSTLPPVHYSSIPESQHPVIPDLRAE
jgi:hypothetical protein